MLTELLNSTKKRSFTPREWQVVKLTVQGLSNKEIARELSMGLRTVKSHLVNIFRKPRIRNRVGLVDASGAMVDHHLKWVPIDG